MERSKFSDLFDFIRKKYVKKHMICYVGPGPKYLANNIILITINFALKMSIALIIKG